MVDLRPKTAEEYVRMVDQAIIEIDEFIACLEFDMDDPGEQLKVLNPLLESVREIRKGMADGSYEFANKDLPFMEVANRMSSQLPFTSLLAVINQTHRQGLNIDADD
ncbi:MAG: general secretion pathway protein GspF [Chromatiales bacterium]|nr:general secretion pathway protein GspF [Chromatiales bacterium]